MALLVGMAVSSIPVKAIGVDFMWEKTNNPTGGDDAVMAVAVDGTGVYVVGYDSNGGNQWRIEKRTESARTIADFPTLFAANQVRMIYQSENEAKPLNCSPAMVSDWLASVYIYTKLGDVVEGLDTDPSLVNQTTGAPLGPFPIVSFGGPVCNPLLKYAESDTTPAGDRAPVKYHFEGGLCEFRLRDGSVIQNASLPYAVINGDQDMFLIEVYDDIAGRHLMYCYGLGWQDTYAAGKYFETTIYPNLGLYPYGWIIVTWEDTNADGFVNTEADGDTYAVVATGTS